MNNEWNYWVLQIVQRSTKLWNKLSLVGNWNPEKGELFIVHCCVSFCVYGQVHSMGCDWLLIYEWRYFFINSSCNSILLQYWSLPIVLPIVCCFYPRCLRRPHWGNADGAESIFESCRTRVSSGPASGPTLKKALYRTCTVVGRRRNKVFLFYQLFFACFLVSGTPPLEGADGSEGILGFCRTGVGCGLASGSTLRKALCRTCLVVRRRTNKELLLGLYWATPCFIFIWLLDASWNPHRVKCYCSTTTLIFLKVRGIWKQFREWRFIYRDRNVQQRKCFHLNTRCVQK